MPPLQALFPFGHDSYQMHAHPIGPALKATQSPSPIVAFIDGTDFEDCIRNAISIGGDSDTLACITGSIAEVYYVIPQVMYDKALRYLTSHFRNVIKGFEEEYEIKYIDIYCIMLITFSLLILAYMIMGKDISSLIEKIGNIDWRGKINALMDKLRPWALKDGRVATRPLLQFYYVMDDDKTSTLDRVLIYAAIIYTIFPMDLIPSTVYKFLGILDDGVAMLYVYKKIKDKITPEINAKVEDTLNDWFGVEYELVEG